MAENASPQPSTKDAAARPATDLQLAQDALKTSANADKAPNFRAPLPVAEDVEDLWDNLPV